MTHKNIEIQPKPKLQIRDSGKVLEASLIRTTSLDANQTSCNKTVPARLILQDDLNTMTKGWSEEELKNERRLVKFNFSMASPAVYKVGVEPIKMKDFTNTAPIISCIYWKEKDTYIVTSVDVILILEYLVQESFNIEEKNRIRRNLQSLKPYTIYRSNDFYRRFFNLIMSMDDPRPRNIEKDLKVFKWSDLFSALNKVISKYSLNIRTLPPSNDKILQPSQTFATYDGRSNEANDEKMESGHITKASLTTNSQNREGFLPSERLKVLRRRMNSGDESGFNNKENSLYHHAIQPCNPEPIQQASENTKAEPLDECDVAVDNSNPSSQDSNSSTSMSPQKSRGSGMAVDQSSDSTVSASDSDSAESNANSNSNSDRSIAQSSSNVFSNRQGSISQFSQGASTPTSVGTFTSQYDKPWNQVFAGDKIENDHDQLQGTLSNHSMQYYQYPQQSQLKYDRIKIGSIPNDHDPLSRTNVNLHNKKLKNENPSVSPQPLKIPSIEEQMANLYPRIEKSKLPPIAPPATQAFRLPSPKSLEKFAKS